ncbi:MAG: branched-chain amino acid ABC transporter permease [Alphaproteobacteria bacterium]|nr:branched-chain amino acid ABC transporter permease [Alphaproteobacteria bacterium]|tara:strand:+ start:463 stop:1431 length:969 start_codon:yes stop_codon:yes gene_type:complete
MRLSPSVVVAASTIVALALVPPITNALQEPFYLGLFLRLMILAIAAISLNLILGFGNMVSFGHAAYMGIGAYVVGIGTFHAIEDGVDWLANGFLHVPLAIVASSLAALIIGVISIRTRGVYFIMITLAFGQMLYFVGVGLEVYGADDGLSLYMRSEFGGVIDINDNTQFYYLVLAILLGTLYAVKRLVASRFGLVIRGARSNERRLASIGVPVYRYKLIAFVIAGAICGIAGVLLANRTDFVSPDMMHWTRSGDLIIMVVLGGMGTLFGPLYGAAAFLLIEEFLSGVTEHWQIVFGPLLILVVIFARGGISGAVRSLEKFRG